MKWKYHIPTSWEHLWVVILRFVAGIGLAIALMASGSQAIPPPESYGDNQCQKAALDYQREFGGSIIWLHPIDDTGFPIETEYGAHILNKIYDKTTDRFYYVDYPNQMYSVADFEFHNWGENRVKQYDLSKEHPEFRLIWYY